MTTLPDQVRAYLEADGYTIADRSSGVAEREVHAWRAGPGGTRQHMNVWMPEIPRGGTLETQEGAYLNRFERARQAAATNIMLVPSRQGISRDFIREARANYGVAFSTPIEFFDTAFRWDGNDAAATIAKRIRDEGTRVDKERISQPFTSEGSSSTKGGDLVGELFTQFRNPDQSAGIHIVQGPAGIGKSWLFSSLFARLHDAFIQDKRERRSRGARPLPLLPEYDPTGRRLSDLLSSFIRTEVDRPMRREVLDWMVATGRGILMLDGLEEVMALDEEFTDQILNYFTLPFAEGRPSVLICLRDSLMNRNQAVIDFCTEYADRTTVYTLDRWDDKSINAFATRKISDQEKGRQFIAKVRSDHALQDIASLPYLCDLLVGEFTEDRLTETLSPAQLIANAAESMVRREYGKRLALAEDVMPLDDVLTFAQDLAQKDMEGGFRGIAPSEVTEWASDWAELVWPEDIEKRSSFELQMSQIAFFEQGAAGRLKFVHEILELYLIGTKYIDFLRGNETGYFVDALNRWEFPSDSITLDLLSKHFSDQMRREDVERITMESFGKPKALKNMLQLLNNCRFGFAFLERSLEKQDLSGLKFSDVDFSGLSFAGCNLDTTEFRACDLRDTEFSGAIISNTGFFNMTSELLEGARFGDMNTVHSIRVDARGGTRHLGEPKAASEWLRERVHVTSTDSANGLPCPAARQLRHMFGKFIRPDGMSRRTWVSSSAISRGAKYVQGSVQEVVKSAVRAEYLAFDSGFDRYHRADGIKYAEMQQYVKRLEASSDMRFLLDEICDEANCRHITA